MRYEGYEILRSFDDPNSISVFLDNGEVLHMDIDLRWDTDEKINDLVLQILALYRWRDDDSGYVSQIMI